MKILFTTLIFVSLYLQINAQQPGTLDKTFGEGGILTGQNYTGYCKDLLIQKDGKIIAAGDGGYNDSGGFLLVRYNADSSPDLFFGDSGRALITFKDLQNFIMRKIALQADESIIAVGYTFNVGKNANTTVVRFKTNGVPDSSFGSNGRVITSLSNSASPASVAIQSDGKIVVAGYTQDKTLPYNDPYTIFLIRFNEDGTLDESFGNKGIMEDINSEPIAIGDMFIQPDGKIAVGGHYEFSKHGAFFIKRYLPSGNVDKQYGEEGEALHYFSGGAASYLSSIILQKNGKVVASGNLTSKDADQENGVLVRFDANGNVDKSFGKEGESTITYNISSAQITDIALQQDNKLIAAVRNFQIFPVYYSYYSVARFSSNGNLDSSFANNGVQITESVANALPTCIALQQDGKIIEGGVSSNLKLKFTLIRYNGDDTNQQPLIVRIKRWLKRRGITWQGVQEGNNIRYYSVQKSTDGITYKDVARVNKKTGSHNYEDAAATGDAYYRIAAVGWDGSRTYSNTILIDDAQQARIFPNPVRDNLQVQGLPANGKTNVSIVDWNGNVRSTATAAGTNCSVNTANLTAGTYLLKIQHNGTTTTQPFVKE